MNKEDGHITKAEYTRRMQWNDNVLSVTDAIKSEMMGKMEEIVLDHFDMDFTDLREYLRDKEEWRRKQEATIPRWIPVTERLPEVGEDVLVYAVGKSDDFSSVIAIADRIIFRLFPSSEGVETWSSPWQYFMTNYEITHWMPLPEPPKEEKE